MATLKVAIVGSGPSAFFVLESLLGSGRPVEIDLIDRSPVPFGLIRYGVAPDHQATKKVTAHFQTLLNDDRVRFFGNVDVGRDLASAELQANYHAVVVATGAWGDAPLNIPGRQLKNVFGASEIVGWYNALPEARPSVVALAGVKHALVIGLGNVALDIARVLLKPADTLRASDVPDHVLRELASSEISTVTIAGRKGPRETKFTYPELREFGTIEDLRLSVEGAEPWELEDDGSLPRLARRNLKTFAAYGGGDKSGSRHLRFLFNATPVALDGDDTVGSVHFERTGSSGVGHAARFREPADMVVTAIGFRSAPIDGIPFDPKRNIIPNEDGKVAGNLFVVGWARSGPVGVIGTNKPHAVQVAKAIETISPRGSPKAGRKALRAALSRAGCSIVGRSGWARIEAWEIRHARDEAPRSKLTHLDDLLKVASGAGP